MSETIDAEMTDAEPLDAEPRDAGATDAPPVVCRLLRTKTAFGTFRGNAWAWQSGRSTTAVYWCLRTMETAGPDDGYTHPHACSAGRGCFEPVPE